MMGGPSPKTKRGAAPPKKAPQPAQSQPPRSVQQWMRGLRFGAATQSNFFYKDRKEKFRWEQTLLNGTEAGTRKEAK